MLFKESKNKGFWTSLQVQRSSFHCRAAEVQSQDTNIQHAKRKWGLFADGDCSNETKRHFPLGREGMTNLYSILKSRDINLPTEVCIIKAMVFPIVLYGCEIWIIKKAEHQRIDAFKLWGCRRLLRVPLTARRSNLFPLADFILYPFFIIYNKQE